VARASPTSAGRVALWADPVRRRSRRAAHFMVPTPMTSCNLGLEVDESANVHRDVKDDVRSEDLLCWSDISDCQRRF